MFEQIIRLERRFELVFYGTLGQLLQMFASYSNSVPHILWDFVRKLNKAYIKNSCDSTSILVQKKVQLIYTKLKQKQVWFPLNLIHFIATNSVYKTVTTTPPGVAPSRVVLEVVCELNPHTTRHMALCTDNSTAVGMLYCITLLRSGLLVVRMLVRTLRYFVWLGMLAETSA